MAGFIRAFALTVGVETGVGVVAGFRSRETVAALLAANLVTHPGFYAFTRWYAARAGTAAYLGGLPLMEAGVAAAEAGLLKFALPGRSWREVACVSFLANAASFLAGVALFWT